MPRSWMVPVALLGVGACVIGPSTQKFAPATSPAGIGADLRFTGGRPRIQGEVLEVQDTALVLLSASRVVLVPIRTIGVGRFTRRGALIAQGDVSDRSLEWLRRVSRFPAGMTPEVRGKLLAAYGQTEPDVRP